MSSKLQSGGCYYSLVVAPSGERLRGEGRYGVFAVQKLCDSYLSASEVSFSRWVAIQIYVNLSNPLPLSQVAINYIYVVAYGLTETTSIVTSVPCGLTAENYRAKSGSVGVPLYNVQLKV